jgi:Glycogen synthase
MWPESALQSPLWNGSSREKNRWVGRYGCTIDRKASAVGQATGFHVEEDTAEALLTVLRRAVTVYQDQSIWDQLVKAGMTTDVSWARSANAYDRLFVSLARR